MPGSDGAAAGEISNLHSLAGRQPVRRCYGQDDNNAGGFVAA